MSRCDIQIAFDRADRTYRGGESVSGKVTVDVNKDTTCKEVLLTHYWQTHGRGNRARGERHKISLEGECQLTAGQRLELPFEFPSERWPLTYRGHYINVDHYVKVAVDVPWAIDPKHEEDYLLLGGAPPEEFDGDRSKTFAIGGRAAGKTSPVLKFVLFGLLGILALLFSVMFIFLLPFFLIGAAIWWMWRRAIRSRVGDVELSVPEVVIGPGDKWHARLTFTPQKSFAINGINLQLTAVESATSGSGTNSTTYTHTVFEQQYDWLPAQTLQGQELFDETLEIDFPDTQAWSLKQNDNRLSWTAVARIDIPRFPDWSKRVDLQLVPNCFLNNVPSPVLHNTPKVAEETAPFVAPRSVPEASVSEERSATPRVDPESVDMKPIVELLDQILAASRFGNDRRQIAEQAKGREFDVVVVADRNSTTFGLKNSTEEYTKGRTILGTLYGCETEIQIFAHRDENDHLSDLERGHTWATTVKIHEWDSLYDRLVAMQVS